MTPLDRPALKTDAFSSARRFRDGSIVAAAAVLLGLFAWLGRLSLLEAVLAVGR